MSSNARSFPLYVPLGSLSCIDNRLFSCRMVKYPLILGKSRMQLGGCLCLVKFALHAQTIGHEDCGRIIVRVFKRSITIIKVDESAESLIWSQMTDQPFISPMDRPCIETADPLQKAVTDEIFSNGDGQSTIDWQTCGCIWNSSSLPDPQASEDEVRALPKSLRLSLLTLRKVLVFGLSKAAYTPPVGASQSFLFRHRFGSAAQNPDYNLYADCIGS